MSYELTGKIKTISEVKQISDTFRVREFVVIIDGDGKYPQPIQLQAANDKCDTLNSFTTGSDIKASFNLRGREWTSPQGEVKTFTSLDAWKIEAATADSAPGNIPNEVPANETPISAPGAEGDDLPF